MTTSSPRPLSLIFNDQGRVARLGETINLEISSIYVSSIHTDSILIGGAPPAMAGGAGNGTIVSATNLGTGLGLFSASAVGGILQFNSISSADTSISISLGGNTVTFAVNPAVVAFVTALASYLTTAAAASTYLTQANAATTYLTQSNASSTYLTPASANSTYVPLSGAKNMTGPLSGTGTSAVFGTISATTYVGLSSNQVLAAGSNNAVQFNANGVVGAQDSFNYVSSTGILTSPLVYGSTNVKSIAISGTGVSGTSGTFTTITFSNLDGSPTKGEIIYYTGTKWSRLANGAGVLNNDGGGTLTWA